MDDTNERQGGDNSQIDRKSTFTIESTKNGTSIKSTTLKNVIKSSEGWSNIILWVLVIFLYLFIMTKMENSHLKFFPLIEQNESKLVLHRPIMNREEPTVLSVRSIVDFARFPIPVNDSTKRWTCKHKMDN